jgi:hypothetical protein
VNFPSLGEKLPSVSSGLFVASDMITLYRRFGDVVSLSPKCLSVNSIESFIFQWFEVISGLEVLTI